ncbi:MAG: TRL-like protein family [Lentisphaerae bacterium]|nr:TRL-like protein family [Lentisphaerota bacterium]
MLAMGCASPKPGGVIFTETTTPEIATSNAQATKVGVSECISVMALVAVGDASIAAAAKNGGITKIHSVDWNAKSILGIYSVYQTIVRGE